MLALSKGLYSASRDIHVSPSESTGLNADLYHPHPNRQLQDQNSLEIKDRITRENSSLRSVLARGGTCNANYMQTFGALPQGIEPLVKLFVIHFFHWN